MKIIDIKSRQVHTDELPKNGGGHFHLSVEPVKKEELRESSHYGLEVGKKEMPSHHPSWRHPFRLFWAFVKTIRLLAFSFVTQFGLRKYRVRISFLLGCVVIFFLINALSVAGSILEAKENLAQKSQSSFVQGQFAKSPQFLFDASLALKEANKRLASLGKIPELVGNLPFTFSQEAAKGREALTTGSAWAELFLRLAGFYQPRYYLVLFQNSAEVRATGGFIGSYALVKVDNGVVEIKKAENVFNLSGQQSLLLTPPLPLQKISENWTFHDLNWFFDFPTSSSLLSWMYEKNGGPTIDGVVAITPGVVEDLLSLIGPIYVPPYNIAFTKENVFDTLQYEVEENYKARGAKDPKAIITEFAPLLLQKLIDYPDKRKLAALFMESLAKKDILASFKNEKEESFLLYQNWGGSMLQDQNDYLAVVSSNINGYKTDRVVRQSMKLHTDFFASGEIVNELSLTREHTGGDLLHPWYNKVNANFLRVYIPQESTLLEARGHTLEFHKPRTDYEKRGFHALDLVQSQENGKVDSESGTRVFEEGGRTVLGNWTYVSPKETTTIVYRYKLPFTLDPSQSMLPYRLTVQKQPGVVGAFHWEITYPPSWKIAWKSESPSKLSRDVRLGILFEK